MIVTSLSLARELRRRRVRHRALIDVLSASRGEAWLPCSLVDTPTDLLVLAAMSVAHPSVSGGSLRATQVHAV